MLIREANKTINMISRYKRSKELASHTVKQRTDCTSLSSCYRTLSHKITYLVAA